MPDLLQTDAQPSLTSLVSGIIKDAQELIRQEMALARREFKEELRKAKAAAFSAGIGIGLVGVGGLLLCFMLVYLIHYLSGWPEWICYLIVGGVITAIGGALLLTAKEQADHIDLVPRQTVETLKENVQWIKNQT